MPKVRIGQSNFSAGEFSPLLAGRSDVALFRNGAETLENFRLHYQGGVTPRFGTRFKAVLGYWPAKLVPFVFNASQYYWFAFSDTRLEIFDADGALIQTLTGAPWTAAMLERLNWSQQGDTMVVVHPDMAMQVISRTAATTFARAAYAFELSGSIVRQPYFKFAGSTVTIDPDTASAGAVVVTASAPIFSSDWVGKKIRHKGKQITLTTLNSATEMAGTNDEALTDHTATTDWDEQVFGAHRGYANSIVWFGDRLWFGGAKSHPIGLWGSKIGAYYNFDVGTAQANEAIWENAPASLLSEIRHVLDFRHLLIFGDRSLLYAPSTESSPLTPATFQIKRQQPYGASYVRPQDFDGAASFVQAGGLVVREGFWIDTDQAYSANPTSGLASHLVEAPTEIAASYGGDSVQDEAYLILVNGDGNLSVFHSVRAEKMAAWVPWSTEGEFKGVAAAPGKIAVLTERDIAAGRVWALEFFDEDAAPLDCAAAATSVSATRTFTGFDHLDAKTVDVVSNGHYLGRYVPSSGTITLDAEAPAVTEIEAGFAFEPTLKPMPVDFDLNDGPVRGRHKRLIKAELLVDSLEGLEVQGRDWLPDLQGDDYASPAPTRTGVIELRLRGVDREAQFEVKIPRGRKGTILSLTREVHVGK